MPTSTLPTAPAPGPAPTAAALTVQAPASAAWRPATFSQRLLRDLRAAVAVSILAALVIVLTTSKPETLYEQLVYSVCIGTSGFVIVDVARLRFWPELAGHPGRWLGLAGVMAVAALAGHFIGVHAGGMVMGHTAPNLAAFASHGRISMTVFTFLGLGIMTLVAVHRERLERVERQHNEAQLRAETIERQALQAQLRLLQAQIEPHMLFNTLANLQGLIALDPDRANAMLEQLIQYLRATLGASRSESTLLSSEFAAMEAYLGLMGVRMGERLAYRLELPAALRHARLPPMLLQPLVENAIVHGLEPKIDGGEVTIQATAHAGLLEIRVSDTGLGLDAGAGGKSGGGVGVATTRERLRVLYGERAGIELLAGQPQGAVVRLTLPLETA